MRRSLWRVNTSVKAIMLENWMFSAGPLISQQGCRVKPVHDTPVPTTDLSLPPGPGVLICLCNPPDPLRPLQSRENFRLV